MSLLQPLTWSLSAAETEFNAFKAWLATQTFLGETQIVDEIKTRPHMCGLLAATTGFSAPNQIKFELILKGLFRTDLVIGNSDTRQFALIEFEDAREDSVFKANSSTKKTQYRPWSPRLEHGFGQVLDWAWVRNDHPSDTVLTSAFGGPITASAYLVIIGRDDSLQDDMERRRFRHRTDAVRIEGVPTQVFTYDGMVKAMEANLINAKSWNGG